MVANTPVTPYPLHHAALTVGQIRHDPQGHQTDAPQDGRHDRPVGMFFIRKNVVLFPHTIFKPFSNLQSPMEPEKGTSGMEMPNFHALTTFSFLFVIRTEYVICRRPACRH